MKAFIAGAIAVSVLLTGGITVRNLHSRQSNQDLLTPFGRYNEAQIWEQSDLLSQKLWPEAIQPSFRIDRRTLTSKRNDGKTFEQQVWIVDCMDSADRYLGKMEFDMQSGGLLYVSLSSLDVPQCTHNSISAADAIRLSRKWIDDVGMQGFTEQARLKQCAYSRPEAPGGSNYMCVWKCPDGEIVIQVDKTTGKPAWILKMPIGRI